MLFLTFWGREFPINHKPSKGENKHENHKVGTLPVRHRRHLPVHAVHLILLRSVYPDDDLGGLELYFNANRRVIPPEDPSAFTITPEANAKIESANPWGVWHVSADLKPHTDYTIKLKAGLRSRDGKVLLNDQMFSFRTGNMEPSVRKLSSGPYFPASRRNMSRFW